MESGVASLPANATGSLRPKKKCAKPTCPRKEQNGGFCKQHYRLAMAGKPMGLVSAGRASEHIAKLKAMGIGTPRIGELAGMPQVSVWRITEQDQILARTEAKILSIPLPGAAHELAKDGAPVAVIGTQRRLRALQVLGYRGIDLAERLGIQRRTVQSICAGEQDFVSADVARRVASLFEELQLTPGGTEVTRSRSLRKGWHPPLAWDEDAIDDPAATPQQHDRMEAKPGDWWDSYLELREMGLEPRAAADRMRLPWKTVYDRLRVRDVRKKAA